MMGSLQIVPKAAKASALQWTPLSLDLFHYVKAIQRDGARLQRALPMTANENTMSTLASSFLQSPFESRYHLGDETIKPSASMARKGELLYPALPSVFALEEKAHRAARSLFGAAYTDFRPLSGVHAMMISVLSFTGPGDVIYTLPPDVGGHFASRTIIERAGRISYFLPWDPKEFDVHWKELAKDITANGTPQAILIDQGMGLFPMDLQRLRELVGYGTTIIYDASHTLGLVLGGRFQNPLQESCDILQGNTHKTFPGPQKALIMTRKAEVGEILEKTLSTGLVSSQHTHHALALYITLLEMEEYGRQYALQIQRNAQALAEALVEEGFALIQRDGRYTESHIVLVSGCGAMPVEGACHLLLNASIAVNARPFCGKPVLRLGVQELTRRGMKEYEMHQIASLFRRLLLERAPTLSILHEVQKLRERFASIAYSLDWIMDEREELL